MAQYLMMPAYRFMFSADGRIQSCHYESVVPKDDVLLGLTYWDKVFFVTPSMPMAGPAVYIDDFTKYLVDEGSLTSVPAPLQGWIDHFTGEGPQVQYGPSAATALAQATCEALDRVVSEKGTRPTLSRQSAFRPMPLYQRTDGVIEFAIREAIPYARNPEDASQFLKWRDKNAVNRRRLNNAIEQLVANIDAGGDPERSIRDFSKDIDDYFLELAERGKEGGLNISLGSVTLKVEPSKLAPWQFLKESGSAAALASLVLPNFAAFAIGVAGGLRPAIDLRRRPAATLRGAHKQFPFELVGSMFS